MNPTAPKRSKSRLQPELSPAVPPVVLFLQIVLTGGIFLWIWAIMWGNWIKRKRPETWVNNLTYVNAVPGALFYINLPILLLAWREQDAVELARLHIAMVLWGTIATVLLAITGIVLYFAQRPIPSRRA